MNFSKVKSSKDIGKSIKNLASKLGFEVLAGDLFEVVQDRNGNDYYKTTGYVVEIWPIDDQAELFYVSYMIQDDGSLYLHAKAIEIHQELTKVEELPLVIKDSKELKEVLKYMADCLK